MTTTPHSRRLTLGLSISLLALSAALAGCERRSSDVPAPTTTPGPATSPSTAPDSGSTSGTAPGTAPGTGTPGSDTSSPGSMPPASAASQ